jgi:hypothetical protein
MSNRRAISSTQSHAEATQRSSEVIRGTQRHSEALRGTQRHSDPLKGTQTHSEALKGNQRQSEALSSTQRPLRGHRDPRRTRGPRLPAPSLVARRRHARAPVCCAIVVRTSPSLSPLTTLAPPPSFSACLRRSVVARRPTSPSPMTTPRSRPSSRAARCARFACSQRVLRGHSEVIRGHSDGTRRPSGALRGHPRALRGQSAARRGHPRRSEGTQRHSQAIRGHSQTILGHHSQSAALRRTRWQSRGRRDPRRPRWPHRVLSVRRVRVRVRVFAALAGDAA